MLRYARIRGLKRRMFLIPGIPVWFMAFGVGLMTPVPYPIAYALIGGLSADSVVKHPEALKVFPEVKLIDFNTATKDALEKTDPVHIERVWDDGQRNATSIKHEGCFIDYREVRMDTEPEKVLDIVKQFINTSDDLMKVVDTGERILACVDKQVAGEKWMEWRVGHVSNVTVLSQTVFFSPRGLPGFLYWYLLYPFHLLQAYLLIQEIVNTVRKRTMETQRHGEEH